MCVSEIRVKQIRVNQGFSVFKNWCYQKMSVKKKCAPKLILFNEKKNWKDSDNFWHRKFTLKVKILQFLTTFTQLNTRSKIFL